LALGMTVKEAMTKIDDVEFGYWQAYYRINPFDKQRDDYMMAMLCHMYANAHRQKGKAAFKVEDFMPKWGTPDKKDHSKALEDKLLMFTKLHNKAIKQKGE
jgi:hypothetical protein